MARASYVYLIIERYSDKIKAGFTVKYEAYRWVESNHWMHHALKLLRMPDGGKAEPVEVEWEEKEIEAARDWAGRRGKTCQQPIKTCEPSPLDN